MKRQVVLATLKKVERMASNVDQLWKSAIPILEEFTNLGYPIGILKFMCAVVAKDTCSRVWLDIRDAI